MNDERRLELDRLIRCHTRVEQERLAGTHVSRLSLIPYDKRRGAYDFDGFRDKAVRSIEVVKHDRFSATPPHYHRHIEFNFMYCGQCRQIIDGREVFLEPGTIAIVDTNTVHELSLAGEGDILINVLTEKEYLAQRLISGLPGNNLLTSFFVNALNSSSSQVNYLVFNAAGNDRLSWVLGELAYEAFFPSTMHEQYLDQLFRLAVMDMLPSIDTHMAYAHLSHSNVVVADALGWLEEHFLDCTLDDLSREIGLSSPYLTTLLKKATGRSFSQLVIEKRMAYARERLLTTNLSIEQVAHETGYENLTYFYRKFREVHGCTPRQLRLGS